MTEKQYEIATVLQNQTKEVHVVLVDDQISDKSRLKGKFQLYLQEVANEQGYDGPVGIAWFNAERTEHRYKAPKGLEDFFDIDAVILPEGILSAIAGEITVDMSEIASMNQS